MGKFRFVLVSVLAVGFVAVSAEAWAGTISGDYWYLGVANDQAAENDEAQSMLDSFKEYSPWKDTKAAQLRVKNNLGGAGILENLKYFHDNVKSGDTFIFYYGGHSGRIPDANKDESDSFDEVIGIRLDKPNPDYVTDDQLAGDSYFGSFPECSTVIVIMNTCLTGGFIDGTSDLNRTKIKNKKNLLFLGATGADELCGPQHRAFQTDVIRALEAGLENDKQTHAKEWGQTLKKFWEERSYRDPETGKQRNHTLAYVNNLDTKHDPTVFKPIPEPTTLALFGLGAAGLAVARRRRRRA